ncbi:MAG: ferredoxin [Dehalococcoidia bacterium]|nr:ferredoxin [Dehalococcoidia bacterium]
MPRLVVDRDTCMSSGQCYMVQPRLLQPDEEDIPVPTAEEFPEEDREALMDAVHACPTGALSIQE